MDVRVAPVTSECQNVKPLGRYRTRHGASQPMHAALKFHVFVLGEIFDDFCSMFQGRKERVAEQRWRLGKEADRDSVFGNHDVAVEITRDDGTDEARSRSGVAWPAPHIRSN